MRYRGPSLIAKIFAWVAWLAPVTLDATYQQEDQGVQLFAENCAACHGTFGEGASGPDLTNILWQSEVSDSDLDRIIRNGVRGTTMPAFGEKLDASARQALVRQIRTLDENGFPRFEWLVNRGQQKGTLVYYIFDLLKLGDVDLRSEPLRKRKKLLQRLLKDRHPRFLYVDHMEREGLAMFAGALALG